MDFTPAEAAASRLADAAQRARGCNGAAGESVELNAALRQTETALISRGGIAATALVPAHDLCAGRVYGVRGGGDSRGE